MKSKNYRGFCAKGTATVDADWVVIHVVCHAATGGGHGLVQGGGPTDVVVDR